MEVDCLLDDVTEIVESDECGWLGDFSRGSIVQSYLLPIITLHVHFITGVLYGNEGGTSGGFAEVLVKKFVEEHGGEISEQRM